MQFFQARKMISNFWKQHNSESGSGLNQTNAIKSFVDKWNIQESYLAMCFNTTASNTGKFSEVCILLKAILQHPLLWTACRHHILEIVLCITQQKKYLEAPPVQKSNASTHCVKSGHH